MASPDPLRRCEVCGDWHKRSELMFQYPALRCTKCQLAQDKADAKAVL